MFVSEIIIRSNKGIMEKSKTEKTGQFWEVSKVPERYWAAILKLDTKLIIKINTRRNSEPKR